MITDQLRIHLSDTDRENWPPEAGGPPADSMIISLTNIKEENNMKKVLAAVLTAALVASTAVGVSAADQKVGYNIFGYGSVALSTLANNQKYVIETFGDEASEISDDFQVDKMISDIENLCASGCDGVLIWLVADNMYSAAIEICDKYGVPYAFPDKVPVALKDQCLADEYFAGAIGPDNAAYGRQAAEYALEKGCTKAIISSGSAGDPTDTPRIEAFQEAFTAGGGEVLQTINSATNDVIQSDIENTYLANPDVDVIYGTGSDYGIAAATVLQTQANDSCLVVTSGFDTAALDMFEAGQIDYLSGDYWISGTMAAIALENYLQGNPLKDADGNCPWMDAIAPFELTQDNPEDYEALVANFIEQQPYSEEEIQAMSGEAGFDYDAFVATIENYSLEDRTK